MWILRRTTQTCTYIGVADKVGKNTLDARSVVGRSEIGSAIKRRTRIEVEVPMDEDNGSAIFARR